MNFDFFDAMTPEEAKEHLQGFLATESAAIDQLAPAAQKAYVMLDYSLTSLTPFLRWLMTGVSVVRVPVPISEPSWIREAHSEGLIDFEESSKYLVLRGGFYMGETFIRSFPSLRWATGNPQYIEKNMPVVTGFGDEVEMAPVMIVENLFTRILGQSGSVTDLDIAVRSWARHAVPS